jgi:two-component system LytT family response regulator
VLIVDDEPLARVVIRQLLARESGMAVVGECRDGVEAVRAIVELRPELVFLDLQMPEVDGFGVVRALQSHGAARMPVIVFVTAYDEFAVRAFEADALDYLVKPFTDERFRMAVTRARRHLARDEAVELGRRLSAVLERLPGTERAAGTVPSEREHLTQMVATSGTKSVVVPMARVDWISSDDYYARLHVGAASHLVRETLATLERRLDPSRFIRTHRTAIVNVERVHEVRREPNGKCELILKGGTRVPVSDRRREAVLKRLAELTPAR